MKKIVELVAILAICFLGYQGFKYYNSTYNGQTAYAIVPEQVPEKHPTYDDSGVRIPDYYSYEYQFVFVKENGDVQPMHYELLGENPKPLEPNSYVTASISEKRVILGPNTVNEADIPADVLAKLNQ